MSNKAEIEEMFVSMGFKPNYIGRALKVYEKNYGHSYNIEGITEIIVRLQLKDRAKQKNKGNDTTHQNNNNMNDEQENVNQAALPPPEIKVDLSPVEAGPFPAHMSLQEARQLHINDKLDHRDSTGCFILATVMRKMGAKLYIHYDGWSEKWDIWSDFSKEIHKFAKAGSISKRPAHRFKQLKKGDYIDINPTQQNPGWKYGEIRKLDQKSGQIRIEYGSADKNYLYWAHLDDEQEIAEFMTKAEAVHAVQVDMDNRKVIKPRYKISHRLPQSLETELQRIQEYMLRDVRKVGKNIMTISKLAEHVHSRFKPFKHSKYMELKKGKFTDFVGSCPGLVVFENKDSWSDTRTVELDENYGIVENQNKDNDNVQANESVAVNDPELKVDDMNMNQKAKIIELQKNVMNEKNKVEELDMKHYNLEVKLQELRTDNKQLNDRNKELERQNTELNHTLHDRNEEIKQIKMQQEKLQRESTEMQQKLEDTKDYVQNKKLEQENIELKEKLRGKDKEMKKMEEKQNEIERENNTIKQKLEEVKDFTQNIDVLNAEELDRLKMKLNAKLQEIEQAKQKLFENHMYCMICMERHKNVVIQGCNHFVLCDQCEQKLETKKCPQCQIVYTNVIKLNI